MFHDQPSGTLLQETLRLLKDRQQTLPELAISSELPFHWLRKLASREIDDPSVNRIQHLWECLTGRKLVL